MVVTSQIGIALVRPQDAVQPSQQVGSHRSCENFPYAKAVSAKNFGLFT